MVMEENKEYWTKRTLGYSKVNESELQSEQKIRWRNALLGEFPEEKKGLRVLDVGTGPGFFAILLAEEGFDVTAVDCTESMLHRAKVNAGDYGNLITWIHSDAQKLPFQAETFDVVVSRNLTWNLEKPDQAYKEWLRVLKKSGILMNFDANWYYYLYDETLRQGYNRDRKRVREMGMDDHYIGTDIDRMEYIAKKLPLSKIVRPQWDVSILKESNLKEIRVNSEIWKQVWSEEEKANYGSTPMFSILAVK